MKIDCHDCGETTTGTSSGNSKAAPCFSCGSWNTTVTYETVVNATGDFLFGGESTPACPECGTPIDDYDDHETGCLKWGMLPENWESE